MTFKDFFINEWDNGVWELFDDDLWERFSEGILKAANPSTPPLLPTDEDWDDFIAKTNYLSNNVKNCVAYLSELGSLPEGWEKRVKSRIIVLKKKARQCFAIMVGFYLHNTDIDPNEFNHFQDQFWRGKISNTEFLKKVDDFGIMQEYDDNEMTNFFVSLWFDKPGSRWYRF